MLSSCSNSNLEAYKKLIKSDFIDYQFEGKQAYGRISIIENMVDKTKDVLFSEVGYEVDTQEFEGYSMINYQVEFDRKHALESFQVFRRCDKNTCVHKFLLIIGVYA